jgi:hypothetical protein
LNVLIAHYLDGALSGAEFAIADMVGQRDPRFEYQMLIPGEGRLAGYYRRQGFSVWIKRVETPRRLYPGLHALQSVAFSRELRSRMVEAVVCNTFPAASRVGTACRIAGIPYAIYVREYISDRPHHRSMLRQATRIFAVSEDVRSYLSHLIAPERIVVVYDHLDMQPLKKRVEAHTASGIRLLPFPEDNPVVGIVGRITGGPFCRGRERLRSG